MTDSPTYTIEHGWLAEIRDCRRDLSCPVLHDDRSRGLHPIARIEELLAAHGASTDVPPTTPPVTEPTEPGWYAYPFGRQLMVFNLREVRPTGTGRTLRWSAHFDSGSCGDCAWDYIAQALNDGQELAPIGPAPQS